MPAAIDVARDTDWLVHLAGPLVTKTSARQVCRIDYHTLERLIREGHLPVVPYGDGQVRITRTALMRYLGLTEPVDRTGAA
jgi:excisionase family DNA binding protein